MKSDDWPQVKAIFNSAIELEPVVRAEYVKKMCEGDDSLRRQVEALLDSYKTDFLENGSNNAGESFGVLKPGALIGRYEIIRLLGAGGMGEVYLASDAALDRKVAIKVFSADRVSSPGYLERFVREARSASALNHPHICTVYEIDTSHDPPFIAMEFVEGDNLSDLIASGKLRLGKTLDIAQQIAEGLVEAHEAGIIHRDIKPANIIVNKRGKAKILDFGLAKKLTADLEEKTEQQLSVSGMIMGTVSYMSPEQVKGENIDHRSDIFSFGVLLYEMISGRRPFTGNSMAETMARILTIEPAPLGFSLPPALDGLIKKCLEKEAARRYRSMAEVLADLKTANRHEVDRYVSRPAEETTIRIVPEPTAEESISKKTSAWNRVVISILASAAVVVTAVATYVSYFQSQSTPASSVSASARSPAFDLYMRGKVKAGSENREEVEGAIKLLEQAVAIDPNYAEAYASLAQAYNTKAFQFAPVSERKQISENAEVAVEKALALNPNLAEGHFARGIVLWTHAKRFPHLQAIQAFKRAINLDTDLDEAHHRLGMVYTHIGLLDKSEEEVRKAVEINPANTMARFRLGTVCNYQGKFEEAVAIYKTVPREITPLLSDRVMADALVHLGRLDEATALVDDYLKANPQDEGGNVTSVKAILLAKAGKRSEAETMIRRAIEIGQGFGHFHHTTYNIASAYAIMNMPDDTMKWLQYTADDGFPNYSFFAIDHNLDNIRQDTRFIDFMKKGEAQMEAFRREIN